MAMKVPEKILNKDSGKVLEVVHPICCGLDIHKAVISGCMVFVDGNGETQTEIREFGTFSDDLLELWDWLLEYDCPVVAMESTGIYWRPVHNLIENLVVVILVNARHIKNVPGRKTDIEDCKWLAGLLRHGLLKGSFIPPKEVRDWRELNRLRKKYTGSLGDYKRRVHKVFETANIKIDSVVSDLFGVTGRNLMKKIIDSESHLTFDDILKCARGTLKGKAEELLRSVQGLFRDHHRFLLRTLLSTIKDLENKILGLDKRIRSTMKPHHDLVKRLDDIPGIDLVTAYAIIAEIGPDLDTFQNSKALCSWAGVCPGNNESAGKRRSGKSPVHKHALKTILIEVAWAAIKKKGSYYKDKYYRLKSRRGAKKAIVAIAHRILRAVFHIVKNNASYKELGDEYLESKGNKKQLITLQKMAEKLGFELVSV
jgi:transposase